MPSRNLEHDGETPEWRKDGVGGSGGMNYMAAGLAGEG
jgi:hypothetical protein